MVRHDRDVSLRLPYLIFRQVLLLGRTSAAKDIELLLLRPEVYCDAGGITS